MEIFKIQKSIVPRGRILIYNEDRSVMYECVNAPLVAIIDADPTYPGSKSYVRGFINDADELVVEERVEAQNW